jgi:hypothetical protein
MKMSKDGHISDGGIKLAGRDMVRSAFGGLTTSCRDHPVVDGGVKCRDVACNVSTYIYPQFRKYSHHVSTTGLWSTPLGGAGESTYTVASYVLIFSSMAASASLYISCIKSSWKLNVRSSKLIVAIRSNNNCFAFSISLP